MCHYENSMNQILSDLKIKKKGMYRPLEIQKILGINDRKFWDLCDSWEPPHIIGGNKGGLECYFIGTHRRVPHHALLAWFRVNNKYELEINDE